MTKALIPRPISRIERLFRRKYAYEFAIALFAVFGGAGNAIRGFFPDRHELVGGLWAIAAGGVLVSTICKIFVEYRADKRSEHPSAVEGCLETLHAVLMGLHAGTGNPRLRITIHVPQTEHTIQQYLEYVGDDRSTGNAGRSHPSYAGMVGQVMRRKERIVARRTSCDYNQYMSELVSEWGYGEEQAKQIDPATMSWMGIPIVDHRNNDAIAGILYLDSTDPGFFDDSKQEVAGWACQGIVKFLYKRHNSHG